MTDWKNRRSTPPGFADCAVVTDSRGKQWKYSEPGDVWNLITDELGPGSVGAYSARSFQRLVHEFGPLRGDGDTDACAYRCGYVSHSRDLAEHEVFEHRACGECGSEPVGVSSVSHEPGCPRLQPGYAYPVAPGGAGEKE